MDRDIKKMESGRAKDEDPMQNPVDQFKKWPVVLVDVGKVDIRCGGKTEKIGNIQIAYVGVMDEKQHIVVDEWMENGVAIGQKTESRQYQYGRDSLQPLAPFLKVHEMHFLNVSLID